PSNAPYDDPCPHCGAMMKVWIEDVRLRDQDRSEPPIGRELRFWANPGPACGETVPAEEGLTMPQEEHGIVTHNLVIEGAITMRLPGHELAATMLRLGMSPDDLARAVTAAGMPVHTADIRILLAYCAPDGLADRCLDALAARAQTAEEG
ncbi:MAG TPA: hypothetical protein VMW52_04875, partial [Phycisphaerae bacterium]|nr:hypothetical protein [Phycisphaerae bacterium]